ncbi:hypothetical protein Pelo_2779 [Pelomyxa schiedti]|nr:hypothetical protein Pelo_2779 [Pelomyxa schiedti]
MAKWFYKGDLRFKGDDGWEPYTYADSAKLEDAYQEDKTTVKLNSKYRVNLPEMYQYRTDDESRQRPIKRVVEAKPKKPKEKTKRVCVVVQRTGTNVDVLGVYKTLAGAKHKQDKSLAKGIYDSVVIIEKYMSSS